MRVFLLGTTQVRLDKLQEIIHSKYPGIVIAGARNGYFDRTRDEDLLVEIRESSADVLFLGMPAPIKEIWCEERRAAAEVPVVLGVGGAFDVLAGFVPRAPHVLQRAGMEWAWRLAQEPRKLWHALLDEQHAVPCPASGGTRVEGSAGHTAQAPGLKPFRLRCLMPSRVAPGFDHLNSP